MGSKSGACSKCGSKMEGGFLLDQSFRSNKPLLWIEAAQSGLSIPIKPGDAGQIEVDAYRCVACGHLELYAGLEPNQPDVTPSD